MSAACTFGHVEILRRLGPDPVQDAFEELFRWADGAAVVELLSHSILPRDVGRVIARQISLLSYGFRFREPDPLGAIQRLFEAGARWREHPEDETGERCRCVLKASDRDFVALLELLATDDYGSTEFLTEMARTPAMRRRIKEVAFIPGPDKSGRLARHRPRSPHVVLEKCGVELPKPPKPQKPPLASTVRIGPWRREGQEIRMERADLHQRVWNEPTSTLAKKWGLSGPGLSKACRRLKISVPPRGYWAKVRAGKPVRRPRLPKLPDGEAQEIVVYAPNLGENKTRRNSDPTGE